MSSGSEAQPSLPFSFLAGLALTGPIFDLLSDRVWWSTWRRQLGQVHLGRALHASAVKHRARSLQLQVSPADSGFGVLCPRRQAPYPQWELGQVGSDAQAES